MKPSFFGKFWVVSDKSELPIKVPIWAFESLVHQVNYLEEVLKLKQNFQKNKVNTDKTLSLW